MSQVEALGYSLLVSVSSNDALREALEVLRRYQTGYYNGRQECALAKIRAEAILRLEMEVGQ